MRGPASLFGLMRLHVRRDTADALSALANAFILPMAVGYMAFMLAPDIVTVRARWLAGALIMATGGACLSLVFSRVAADRWSGGGKLLATLPIAPITYAASLVAYAVAMAAVIAAFGVAILGFFHLAAPSWVGLLYGLIVACLAGVGLGSAGLMLGVWSPSVSAGDILVTAASLVLAVISPVLYPLSQLSTPWRWLAWMSPYTHMAEAVAAASQGRPAPYHLLVLAGFAALMFGLAARHAKAVLR